MFSIRLASMWLSYSSSYWIQRYNACSICIPYLLPPRRSCVSLLKWSYAGNFIIYITGLIYKTCTQSHRASELTILIANSKFLNVFDIFLLEEWLEKSALITSYSTYLPHILSTLLCVNIYEDLIQSTRLTCWSRFVLIMFNLFYMNILCEVVCCWQGLSCLLPG